MTPFLTAPGSFPSITLDSMTKAQIDPVHFTCDSMDRLKDIGGTVSGSLRQANSYHRTSTILALLLLVHVGWIVWQSATNMPTIDFLTFWSVPHALSRKPIVNIYSPDSQRDIGSLVVSEARLPNASEVQQQATERVARLYDGRVDATGTPLLYAAIGWLSSGNFRVDQRRFVFVCMLCLVLSMLVLKDLLRFSVVEISLLIIFTATYYAPALADMQVGNINEIQLFAIALFMFFTARAQPLLAGLTIGTATMLKPTPVMVLALSLIAGLADREYRQLLRMFAGCLIAVAGSFVISAAYFGNPAIWIDFLRSLPRTLNGISYSLESGNFSLSELLFGATGGGSLIIPLVLLGIFSWLLFATRQSAGPALALLSKENNGARRMHSAFAVGGGGCAIMLLSSPLVWPHYYLLLLPLSLYVTRPGFEPEDDSSVRGIRARGVAVSVLPFVLLLMFSFLAELIVKNDPRSICIVFTLATVATLALASYRFWQQRRLLIISTPTAWQNAKTGHVTT